MPLQPVSFDRGGTLAGQLQNPNKDAKSALVPSILGLRSLILQTDVLVSPFPQLRLD